MKILASLENNQSFYSIADFFVRFTTLSERNVSLQEEKIQRFVAPGQRKMISVKILLSVPPNTRTRAH